MIVTLSGLAGLRNAIGTTLGPSAPITVDQTMIDRFAEATGDHQWIHNDVERATLEHGHTIAHGLLTLSLIVQLANSIYRLDEPVAINYGFDRVRFPASVPAGSTLTATAAIRDVAAGANGTKVLSDVIIAAAGVEAPVCVAQWWTFYPTLTTDTEHSNE